MAEAGFDEKNPPFRLLRKKVKRRELIPAGNNLRPGKCEHLCFCVYFFILNVLLGLINLDNSFLKYVD